jgi:hypothetical protein
MELYHLTSRHVDNHTPATEVLFTTAQFAADRITNEADGLVFDDDVMGRLQRRDFTRKLTDLAARGLPLADGSNRVELYVGEFEFAVTLLTVVR